MPDRSRIGRAAGCVVAGLTALAVSGCGGDLSAEDIEGSIRDGLADRGAEVDTVECPEAVAAEVEAMVVCEVDLRDEAALGEPVDRVRVTVTSVDGNEVRYRLEPLAVGVADDAGTLDEAESTQGPDGSDSDTNDASDNDASDQE